MTNEPLVTVNKAHFDIFNQYKKVYKLIRGLSYIAPLRGGGRSEIEAVARLLLGTGFYVYRVFFDHLRIPHPKFGHFMATFLLVCRMNTHLHRQIVGG